MWSYTITVANDLDVVGSEQVSLSNVRDDINGAAEPQALQLCFDGAVSHLLSPSQALFDSPTRLANAPAPEKSGVHAHIGPPQGEVFLRRTST